jgi:hypothetical protein
MPSEIEVYRMHMADSRTRIGVVKAAMAGVFPAAPDFLSAEIIFLQLPKVLELIARNFSARSIAPGSAARCATNRRSG